MTLLNLAKAAAVLSVGVMYYRACDRSVERMQVPALKSELNRSKKNERELNKAIAARIAK